MQLVAAHHVRASHATTIPCQPCNVSPLQPIYPPRSRRRHTAVAVLTRPALVSSNYEGLHEQGGNAAKIRGSPAKAAQQKPSLLQPNPPAVLAPMQPARTSFSSLWPGQASLSPSLVRPVPRVGASQPPAQPSASSLKPPASSPPFFVATGQSSKLQRPSMSLAQAQSLTNKPKVPPPDFPEPEPLQGPPVAVLVEVSKTARVSQFGS